MTITFATTRDALMICAIGVPVPEDITLASAGFIAYLGGANVHLMMCLCMFGVLFGDSMIFFAGQKFGPRILKHKYLSKALNEKRLESVKGLLDKHGYKMIFAARFMPGFRMPAYFSTGMFKIPFRTFFLMDGLASVLSVPAIVYSMYYFGDRVEWVIRRVHTVENAIVYLIVAIVLISVAKWALKKQIKKRI